MTKVEPGQRWWDAEGGGFAQVRSVSAGVATVSEPCDFWGDAATRTAVRRVRVVAFGDAAKWRGPYLEPSQCPEAQYYPSLGFWGRRGTVVP